MAKPAPPSKSQRVQLIARRCRCQDCVRGPGTLRASVGWKKLNAGGYSRVMFAALIEYLTTSSSSDHGRVAGLAIVLRRVTHFWCSRLWRLFYSLQRNSHTPSKSALRPSPSRARYWRSTTANPSPTPPRRDCISFAEMPINYLGFILVYRGIKAPLPSQGELAGYRAIATWLLEPLHQPDGFVAWLEAAL